MDEATSRKTAALMGVFVADAAALALHWLYDAERLHEIAEEEAEIAFLELDPERFKKASGEYSGFYHPGKCCGDLSHYGNYHKIALDSLTATNGKPDPADYQKRFADHFGPGGAYDGYIDHATSGTLANLAAAGDEPLAESGPDDDQIPALGTVTAVAVADPAAKDLTARIEPMVRVTSTNALANEAAKAAGLVIAALLQGADMTEALQRGAAAANGELGERLEKALAFPACDIEAAAGEFGRPCPLKSSLPLSFVILRDAASFAEGVRANTRAGGDNCGRALIVGSALGAQFGFAPETGIPLDWLMRVHGAPRFYDQALKLSGAG